MNQVRARFLLSDLLGGLTQWGVNPSSICFRCSASGVVKSAMTALSAETMVILKFLPVLLDHEKR